MILSWVSGSFKVKHQYSRDLVTEGPVSPPAQTHMFSVSSQPEWPLWSYWERN